MDADSVKFTHTPKPFYIKLLTLTVFAAGLNFLLGQDLRSELERIIAHDTDISYELTPGFIVGILDGDSVYIEAFGGRADQRATALSPDDLFEVGSVTKLFTAALIDRAVETGKLSLDALLHDYIPLEYHNPRLENLSIGQLLDHQSGLPKRPYGFGQKELDPQNPYQWYTREDLMDAYRIFVPEGANFVYSHMNYALLGLVLEAVYAMDFESLVAQEILEPLGMARSFIHFKEEKNSLTPGLDRSGVLVSPWLFASFEASEALKTTMADLLLFVRAHLGIGPPELCKSFADNFDRESTSFNEHISVASGWQIFKINKQLKAVLHTGSTSGHSAFVGMVRETGTGVVVLSNSGFGTRDLGLLILRMINHNWKRKPNKT